MSENDVCGWRSIASAPMDGTIILIYAYQGLGSNGIHVAKFDKGVMANGYGHKWIIAEYQNLGPAVSGFPIAWMPLPKPPQVVL